MKGSEVMKMTTYIIAIFLVGLITAPTVIVSIENAQEKANRKLVNKDQNLIKDTEVAVLYYSRSGNTAVMAKTIATLFQADLINIDASKYKIGFWGLAEAAGSFQNREVEIDPKELDLSKYKKVFLGSPIWFYRPAPPIFEFVKNNKFSDQEVVLFNSYNSNFGQDHIDEFKSIVMRNGAKTFEHKAVKRGRVGSQISTKEFIRIIKNKFSQGENDE